MIWTLTSGATVYEITNGTDRTLNFERSSVPKLVQTTQEETLARAQWLTGFHSRAARFLDLQLVVQCAPCASLAAAFVQKTQLPASCPRGGVLTGLSGDELTTYADAWVLDITPQNVGISNQFTYNLRAINPTASNLSTLAQMDSRYIANLSAVVGLTGGGATKLDGYTTTDVAAGFTAFLPALIIGEIAVAKMMHLVTGTDAENADPAAGLLIIRPDDYNAGTNAKVWKEKL